MTFDPAKVADKIEKQNPPAPPAPPTPVVDDPPGAPPVDDPAPPADPTPADTTPSDPNAFVPTPPSEEEIPDFLADAPAPPALVEPEDVSQKYKELSSQYNQVVSDPLVDAYLKWKSAGGSDVRDFFDKTGISTKEKSIREYITDEAQALGLTGDELVAAVEEKMSDFEGKPKIDQRKILSEYKSKDSAQSGQLLSRFSEQAGLVAKERQAAIDNSAAQLQKRVSELKEFKSLPIDEQMAKTILEQAPYFSPEMKDENGKVVGYDVETGITMAMYANFGNKVLRSIYMKGYTEGQAKLYSERNRPDPAPGGGGGPAPVASKKEAIKQAVDEYRKQHGHG
jgi:hypothetical protein